VRVRTVHLLLLLLLQPLPDAAAVGQERPGASTDQLPPSHETPTIIRHSERRTTTDKNTRLTKNTQLPNSQWQEGVQYVKKKFKFCMEKCKNSSDVSEINYFCVAYINIQ